MDVKNNLMEKTILKLRKSFCNYFDWNSMDVNYARVDTLNKSIFAMPSNYEWHLIYFDEKYDCPSRRQQLYRWDDNHSRHLATG